MASDMAIKPGRKLESREMISLVDQLFACRVPELSPGGEKTFIMINSQDIQQLFR
jgi:DNA mismatch repair protein MutL